MSLHRPRRDLDGYSVKACEGFKCYEKEVGWGEARHQLLFLKRHLLPAAGGVLY